jgi:Thioredoxin
MMRLLHWAACRVPRRSCGGRHPCQASSRRGLRASGSIWLLVLLWSVVSLSREAFGEEINVDTAEADGGNSSEEALVELDLTGESLILPPETNEPLEEDIEAVEPLAQSVRIESDAPTGNDDRVQHSPSNTMPQYTTDDDSSTSTEPPTVNSLPFILDHYLNQTNGVYQLQSLPSFQAVLDHQLKSKRAQLLREDESSHAAVFWMLLLYNPNCTYSPTLLETVEGVAAKVAAAPPQVDAELGMPDDGNDELFFFVGRIDMQESDDPAMLFSLFGIESTPAIALVSADSRASYLVEYTGRLTTANELYWGAQHYFDTLALTSQPSPTTPPPPPPSTTTNDPVWKPQQHPLLSIQPRAFTSMARLQSFLHQYTIRLFFNYADDARHYRPVLSQRTTSAVERFYIHWLFNTTKQDDIPPPTSILLVQCRLETTRNTDKQALYDDFDKMARALQGRRDRLFFVLQPTAPDSNGGDVCEVDGSVDVYEIPITSDLRETLVTHSIEDWATVFTHYRFDPSEWVGLASSADSKLSSPPVSRLVEFMIKACTDPVLWFDRQTVAPIVFSNFRKVHVVLLVDMHHQVLSAAAHSLAASTGNQSSSTERSVPGLDVHPIALINKRAVSHFQKVCQMYRETATTDILDESTMVCLIVPSTETRVLTTFGLVDAWSRVDAAFIEAVSVQSGSKNASQQSDETNSATKSFPSMFITDQRFGGTLRYYKSVNSADDEIETLMDSFLASYRAEELPYAVKSSKAGARTNEAGVRIVTADTVEYELFGKFELEVDPPHALILFIAPTCGHCKRFVVIWNRLSRLLKHIGWESMFQLYQMDVTENDVSATSLGVDIEWLPDVYYVPPASKHLIRYNVTDELGDGVGAIRDVSEILEWLFHELEILTSDQIEELLSAL